MKIASYRLKGKKIEKIFITGKWLRLMMMKNDKSIRKALSYLIRF